MSQRPLVDGQMHKKERNVSKKLKEDLRAVLNGRLEPGIKEDRLFRLLSCALEQIGQFCRTGDGTGLFFRHSERKLYEVSGRPEAPFGKLVTWLADLSVTAVLMKRSLDRLQAQVAEEAETVQVHALAYNTPDGEVVALNDFGGGMWHRRRGGQWKWKPNGSKGILFWTPAGRVEAWRPELSTDAAIHDEDHIQWFLEQPHFADDVLTVHDQRLLLRALLLSLFFPSRNPTRPVAAHLGLNQKRQHDTGKTTAGKLIGHVLVGPGFEPTPAPESSEKGVEALQLELMHKPYVLLDNVDTEIKWLNDFLCTYATGASPSRRRLYTDTQQIHIEYRGQLALTSRKATFKRPDTASRIIPFRFAPIAPTERKTEWELLDPVIARRAQIWAGLLSAAARVQDLIPTLTPPSPSLRLADFEQFGWCVAAVYDQADQWQAMIPRLRLAQAGFALEGEVLVPVLRKLLQDKDVPDMRTSEFFERLRTLARDLELDLAIPMDAAACTSRINELHDALEAMLEIKIEMHTLHGYTHIRITRGTSWQGARVSGVRGVSDPLRTVEVKYER